MFWVSKYLGNLLYLPILIHLYSNEYSEYNKHMCNTLTICPMAGIGRKIAIVPC